MLVKSDPSGANPLPRIHEYSLCQAKPPRLCTDVATLIGARRMTLDGDRVTYAQYYPAVMRAIELLRPPLHIDAEAIQARLETLVHVRPCKKCMVPARQAVADITNLLLQVSGLYAELIEARREAANYLAAIRAALGADEDGEPDPLAYLRDEFPEHAPGEWCL